MENINFWLESKLVDKGVRGLFQIYSVRGNTNCFTTGPETTYFDKISSYMYGGPVVIRVWGGKSYRLISETSKVLFYEIVGEKLVTGDLDDFIKKVYGEMGIFQKIWVYLKSM